jgi:3-hydroxyisobutyrate dehydrogenase-like beta-hydroxyacid dehydrogenase
MNPNALRVGYIGLGTMGAAMAGRLVIPTNILTVFDLRPAAVNRLVQAGALGARSVAAVANAAEVVLVNVVDDGQVVDVVEGSPSAPGLLGALCHGSVIVIQSTVHPATCRRLAVSAAARGVAIVDAPFTGGAAAAARGTLALLVGGEPSDVVRCAPALSRLGAIHHVGPVGSGQAAKLANNLVIAITMAAVHESLSLAEAEGIDETTMLGLLTAGAADNWVVRNWDAITSMAHSYPQGAVGLANLTRKDVNAALAVAQEHGIELPSTRMSLPSLAAAYQRAANSPSGQPSREPV